MEKVVTVKTDLIDDACLYGKPMELLKCWCDVICFLEFESKTCCCVLYFLKSLDGGLGTVCK